MPLYEYQCESCGHRFERIQKFSDPAVESCPQCGGGVRKLLSSPAIQFKGSGWYITDYARKGSGSGSAEKSGAAGDGKSDSQADTKTETKSETKTEVKTETKPDGSAKGTE
jgi:putative FmdB family regulatory protein